MSDFLAGLVTMGYLTAAVFFLKFWRRTTDRLFLAFFIAFLLFGFEQGLLFWARVGREEQSWFYLLRIIGFACIIAGVIDKNRRSRTQLPSR
jgi:Family of unknown function (DUF5985)